jgi:hypothetical protein
MSIMVIKVDKKMIIKEIIKDIHKINIINMNNIMLDNKTKEFINKINLTHKIIIIVFLKEIHK